MSQRLSILLLLLALSIQSETIYGQENPQPAKPPPQNQSCGKQSHAHDFLLKGTVFTNTAYAFPGVRIRLRRKGDKKFRWETYTNSRGEFAIRVPQGADYELQVRINGYADQSRAIDAKEGDLEQGIMFQMQPLQMQHSGGKT